jgi:hypothetical protein
MDYGTSENRQQIPFGVGRNLIQVDARPRIEPLIVTATTFYKFNLNTSETIAALGSTALFRRLRYHGWLRPLEESRPGRPSLYPMRRIEAAQDRLEGGEFPPLLPCELRSMPGLSSL